MTKTLSPWHYGELQSKPVRTLLLLRAWAIWRARHAGWAGQSAGRVREVEQLLQALEQDIRTEDGRAVIIAPIFDNHPAHAWLRKWVPDLVARILA